MWGVQDLVIRYGTHMAVRGVSLSVAPGSVLALVGGDGAGKTSILRAIVGALQPVSGRVSRPPKEQIGYVSAGPGLYRDLTVEENLRFAGRAYGMTPQAVEEGSRRLLEAMALSAARGRVAGKLSGGMRQKLGLAMALLHGPQLLVLDEPTTGVDPVSRAELWRQIARAAAAGAAVVIATSYIDRAEEVLVLSEGTPLLNGPPEAVVASLPGLLSGVPGGSSPGGVGARGGPGRPMRSPSPAPSRSRATSRARSSSLSSRGRQPARPDRGCGREPPRRTQSDAALRSVDGSRRR